MPSKIKRCRERAPEDEHLSDKEMAKMIKHINKARARTHSFFSSIPWGDKEGYHLCVNTSGTDIKILADHLANYAEHWFAMD